MQTYWRIQELKLGFELGGSPWSFTGTPTFFVTHSHLDHLASIPVSWRRRRMMKMEPPTIYLPEESVDNVHRLLHVWQRLDRGRMACRAGRGEPGTEIELSREHVVTAFPTKHTVPSLGYVVWERRKKLKPEYQGLQGTRFRDIRLSGTRGEPRSADAARLLCGRTAPAGLDAIRPSTKRRC